MWKLLVVAVMVQLSWHIGPGEAAASSIAGESSLRDSLLNNYDKRVRPSDSTVINISSITLIDLDMKEADHAMTVHSWLHFMWKDPRLAWSLDSNPGVDNLDFEFDSIWKPDITNYNAIDSGNYVNEPKVLFVVFPSGNVFYVPPVTLHFYCVMDLTYWPHDSHSCHAKFGSWVHHMEQIDFRVTSDTPTVNLTSYSMNNEKSTYRVLNSKERITVTEWELEDSLIERHEAVYPCCEETYVSVLVNLKVRRNAPAFAWTVKIPAACLSLLTLILFLLPPNASEKMTFGGLCIVLHVFFIAYTNHVIAQAPSHTPIIVQLACHQLVMVVAVVIVAALIVRMAKNPHCSPLSASLKQGLLSASGFLCLSNYRELVAVSGTSRKSEEVELGEGSEGEVERERRYKNEWLLLAAVLDRLALIVCLLMAFVLFVRFGAVI